MGGKKPPIDMLLEFGIVNIDKPSGPTSFTVSDFVRKTLGLRKTSHFGTLDPMVSGVLPIALNRACKLTGFFLGEDKEYVGIMRLHEEVPIEKVKEMITKKFLGEISQLPPKRSRVKRQVRQRAMHTFELIEQQGKNIVFRVVCQGGTYVRKLIHDLGEELGVGAHMLELRRIRAGIFTEHDKKFPSVNLYDFEKAVTEYKQGNEMLFKKIIIPGEMVMSVYPSQELKKKYITDALHGKTLLEKHMKKNIKEDEGTILCVYNEKQFLGMYKVIGESEKTLKPLFVYN